MIGNFSKKNISGILKRYRSQEIDESQCLFANQYTSFNLDYKFTTSCNSNLLEISASNELVKSRNTSWMKKIPFLLENNNCFIAVGLMHLYYDCGLLEQLKKLGYKVEKVEMK